MQNISSILDSSLVSRKGLCNSRHSVPAALFVVKFHRFFTIERRHDVIAFYPSGLRASSCHFKLT